MKIQDIIPGDLDKKNVVRGKILTTILVFAIFMQSRFLWYIEYSFFSHDFQIKNFLKSALCHWDSAWYISVASNGYDLVSGRHAGNNEANWAFFPVYPGLVAGVVSLSGLSYEISGVLISNVFSFLTAVIARKFFSDFKGYLFFLFLFLFGPFSVYFGSVLTEPAFFFFSALALIFIKEKWYAPAAFACCFASGVRVTGMFLVIPLVYALMDDAGAFSGKIRQLPAFLLRNPKVVFAVLLAPAGLFAFMAYLYLYMGDALAFSHVQVAWGRLPGNPLIRMGGALRHWRSDSLFSAASLLAGERSDLWSLAWVFLGMFSLVLMLRRRDYGLLAFSEPGP